MAPSSQFPKFAYFEGQIVPFEQATVSVMNHTLNYGTGAFGGLRGYWNEEEEQLFIVRPLDHFARFLKSARMLMMDLDYEPQDLVDALLELIRAEDWHENIYIRPLAYVPNSLIGVKLHDLDAAVSIISIPFGGYLPNEDGARVTVSSWRRIDDNVIPARGKIIGAYANSALIKTDAMLAGYDEAVVLNESGHVSEASAANVFIIRDGVAITPPVTDNILEGITRRSIIHLLREELGIEVVERSVDRTELFICDEMFFCGTGVQVVPVTSVDNRKVGDGKMGPIVRELKDLYFDVVKGKVEKYRGWLTPVYTTVPAR